MGIPPSALVKPSEQRCRRRKITWVHGQFTLHPHTMSHFLPPRDLPRTERYSTESTTLHVKAPRHPRSFCLAALQFHPTLSMSESDSDRHILRRWRGDPAADRAPNSRRWQE